MRRRRIGHYSTCCDISTFTVEQKEKGRDVQRAGVRDAGGLADSGRMGGVPLRAIAGVEGVGGVTFLDVVHGG